jgi:hypothetical protein
LRSLAGFFLFWAAKNRISGKIKKVAELSKKSLEIQNFSRRFKTSAENLNFQRNFGRSAGNSKKSPEN